MAKVAYQKLDDHSSFFWGLLAFHVLVIALGSAPRSTWSTTATSSPA